MADTLEAAIARIASLDRVEVTVGIQGQVAQGGESLTELVTIAAANEYGTDTIPPRPFLRTSLSEHGRKWSRGMTAAAKAKARGDDAGASQVLRELGIVAVSDVQTTILEHGWTPNADSTIARKGSSQPLVDDSQLVQSIRAAVEVPGRPPEIVG